VATCSLRVRWISASRIEQSWYFVEASVLVSLVKRDRAGNEQYAIRLQMAEPLQAALGHEEEANLHLMDHFSQVTDGATWQALRPR
jgi:hypothetical protein